MDRRGPKTKEDFKESLVFQRDLAEMLGQEVKTLQGRVEELEAELRELKSCPNESWECAKEQRRLEAENARLLKALELIAKPNLSLAESGGLYRQEIAEKALHELAGEKK